MSVVDDEPYVLAEGLPCLDVSYFYRAGGLDG